MPGLLRGMVQTAAIVGTATATRNAIGRRQATKNAEAYAQATNVYTQETVPEQQSAPPPEEDYIAQLERLGALKAQGLLTEEEFAAAKKKLLAV